MRTRLFALVMVMLMALLLVPVVGAQDDPGCFGLSAEDCDMIDAASANLLDASSFSLDWSLDVSVSGLGVAAMIDPNAGIPASVAISANGSGVIDLTPESGDVGILQQTADYKVTMDDQTMSGSLEVILVDGTAYLVVDGKAYGVDNSSNDMDPDTIADLLQVDSSALAIKGTSSMLTPGMLDYLDYSRSGDDYAFTVDVGGLLASEDFASMLPFLLSMAGQEGALDSLGGADAISMFTSAIESNIIVSQSIDPETPILTDLGFDMSFNFDIGAAFGMGDMEPIAVSISFAASFDQVGESFSVKAPADAEMLSEDEFNAMLDQITGGLGF